MPLHIFRHVEADQLDRQAAGELARHLGLADAGRAGEQVAADRLLRLAQAGAGQLDGAGQRVDRLVLAEHHGPEVARQVEQVGAVVARHALGRDAGDLGDHRLDVLHGDRLAPLALRQQHLRRADLVDHVDRLVRQLAVVDVARRQLHRRLDRLRRVLDLVVALEGGAQAGRALGRPEQTLCRVRGVEGREHARPEVDPHGERHGVADRLTLLESDSFSALRATRSFRLIASNPPYVSDDELKNLQREVNYEPRGALAGGPDGLSIIRRLLGEARPFLRPGGYFVFEIGFEQTEAVERLIDRQVWQLLEVRTDLQKIPRTFVLQAK